jgi:hypothetical protein
VPAARTHSDRSYKSARCQTSFGRAFTWVVRVLDPPTLVVVRCDDHWHDGELRRVTPRRRRLARLRLVRRVGRTAHGFKLTPPTGQRPEVSTGVPNLTATTAIAVVSTRVRDYRRRMRSFDNGTVPVDKPRAVSGVVPHVRVLTPIQVTVCVTVAPGVDGDASRSTSRSRRPPEPARPSSPAARPTCTARNPTGPSPWSTLPAWSAEPASQSQPLAR